MLCLGLTYSATTFADENLQAQFKTAYQSYLTAQNAPEGAKAQAKQAYQRGKKLFGVQADNTANLAVNYANEMGTYDNKIIEQRFALYKQAYTVLVANHNESDLIVMDALLGMAETAPSAYKSNNYFKELIDIAEQNENPKLAMDMKFAAAQHLARNHTAERFITARNYLEADEYYQANLPENEIERVKANFLVAAFAEGRKDYDEAILRLNKVVAVFDQALEFDHSTELAAHSKLVALYERTGKGDEATKHCIAIAKMVPWQESQEQT
ncbi:MAG: energy transducer TonB, partial [Pseudoalteromonas sp.]